MSVRDRKALRCLRDYYHLLVPSSIGSGLPPLCSPLYQPRLTLSKQSRDREMTSSHPHPQPPASLPPDELIVPCQILWGHLPDQHRAQKPLQQDTQMRQLSQPQLHPQLQQPQPYQHQPHRPPHPQLHPQIVPIVHDPSQLHPVFFTNRLRRPPVGVRLAQPSPVAHGYVYQDGVRNGDGSRL